MNRKGMKNLAAAVILLAMSDLETIPKETNKGSISEPKSKHNLDSAIIFLNLMSTFFMLQ